MLALERHRKLIALINTRGTLRTSAIAKELGVTEETVRRDFEKLETTGELIRSHGGALRLEASRRDFPLHERMQQNTAAKTRIAKTALTHVKEGQTIYFDASTTVLQLASILPDQRLTILTNALQTAQILSEKPLVTVYVLGGQLSASSLSCTGWAAGQGLELHHIDTAFLSCRGLDPALGISEAAEEHARIKRHVVQRADKIILLADHSKAGLASSFFYAKNSEVDLWITDTEPPEDVREAVVSQGMTLEVAL